MGLNPFPIETKSTYFYLFMQSEKFGEFQHQILEMKF
jgi:hypothetical protein